MKLKNYKTVNYAVQNGGNDNICYLLYPEHNKWNIRKLIQNSMLEEVYTTPKPGLVDTHDCGAHHDMDINTFEISATVISPYIEEMFYAGYEWKSSLPSLFLEIRKIGIQAESAMFQATNGVNTHKGMIFSMGIIATAVGYCYKKENYISMPSVFQTVRKMTAEIIEREFTEIRHNYSSKNHKPSHGEYLYLQYGERGIRGEAQKGFPLLAEVLYPLLRRHRQTQSNENHENLLVLLTSMTVLNDTTVINRGGYDSLEWLQRESRHILTYYDAFSPNLIDAVTELNRKCIKKNISPGGSADLLACAIFLWKMESLNFTF